MGISREIANDIKISIVIPVFNAEATIIETLEAINKIAGKNVEVVVVDDGSNDSSTQLITEFAKNSNFTINLVHQRRSGPATARNNGVGHALGDIVIFLDSDCLPTENWLEEMTNLIGDDIIGCYCWNRVRNENKITARYVHYEMTKRHEGMIGKDIDSFSTYSASFRKDVFLACGSFDHRYREASGEDFDLTYRITKAGYRLKFVDTTFVYQYHPDSWRSYFTKQFKRGYWSARLHLKNKAKIITGNSYTGHEIQVQFILVIFMLLSIPLSVVFSPVIFICCVGVLLLSNLPLGVWTFSKEKKFLLLAPLVASVRSVFGAFGVIYYILTRGFTY